MIPTRLLLLLPLAGLPTLGHADNCDAIGSQIEARMRAGGLPAAQVIAVDRTSAPGGRVVGSCASGSKQLVLVAGSGAGSASNQASSAASHAGSASGAGSGSGGSSHAIAMANNGLRTPTALRLRRLPADNIITECKDGRVVRGPDCSRPAPRPKPAASAESTADLSTPAAPADSPAVAATPAPAPASAP